MEVAMLRLGILLLLAMFCVSNVLGCSWAGRTTGKVVNKIEDGSDDFEQGYKKERKKQQ